MTDALPTAPASPPIHPDLSPPMTLPKDLVTHMTQQGFAVLSRASLARLTGCNVAALDALSASWRDLPPDAYLKDGGRYRRRRHSCFVVQSSAEAEQSVRLMPHRAHWQPLDYNALHGGMQRWFAPMLAQVLGDPVWPVLLQSLAHHCSQLKPVREWFVEAHQFRIDTQGGIGRPTPEGAHRDGVDFVAVLLVARHRIKGGETRVFEAAGSHGQRFTLTEPWSLLLLDDERVIHETTPIQPLGDSMNGRADAAVSKDGYRDTLVLTFRQAGFQEA